MRGYWVSVVHTIITKLKKGQNPKTKSFFCKKGQTREYRLIFACVYIKIMLEGYTAGGGVGMLE